MRAIKARIYPNAVQKALIEQHFGCVRWIYNYGLEKKIKTYNESKINLSGYDISNGLSELKKSEETKWLKDVNSQVLQQSLKDLDSAFSMFFRKIAKFPRFKSRKNTKQSFRVPQHFQVDSNKKTIKLPKIGTLNYRDKFDFNNKEIRSITISKNSTNQYFASVLIKQKETKEKYPIEDIKTIGIDLGIKDLAIFSTGEKISNPKFLKKSLNKLQKQSQKFSNKKKGSKNYEREKQKLAKIHLKISNQRQDFLQKLSTQIVENQDYTSVAIEDLAVSEMNKTFTPINRAIGDCGFRMFRNMLEYKCEWAGKNLLVINRFEASSKTCSCGVKNEELTLDDRNWICQSCGTSHDRDVLAANNIKLFALVGHTNPLKEEPQLL